VACIVAEIENEDDLDSALLPPTLASFMGTSNDVSFKHNILYRGSWYGSLTSLNDNGVTFKTIARIFREQSALKNIEKY